MVSRDYEEWRDDEATSAPSNRIGAWASSFRAAIGEQADRWVLWAPVCLAVGIGAYFALPVEPPSAVFALALAGAVFFGRLARRGALLPATLFLCILLLGFVLAKARTEAVRAPVLRATTGLVSLAGEVERVEGAPRGLQRLRLRVARIDGVAPAAWPARVQVTTRRAESAIMPGDFVTFRARLSPPQGPVEPGGYDPAVRLWYEGIGATGFSLEQPVVDDARSSDPWSWRRPIQGVRDAIGRRIDAAMEPLQASIGTALITGERGFIPDKVNGDLRASGLYHVLSISGLHLTLVAGTAFWLVRAGLALSQTLALNYPIKKWAAAGSLFAASAYLLISGAEVATQRAYLMLAIMCLAVLLDRPALSMRNVALAALAILIVTPEAVLSASFQMSFLAVMGLIAFYEEYVRWRREHDPPPPRKGLIGRAARFVAVAIATSALTTLVASLLTSLPGAYHFNRLSNYALLANVLAMPVVSVLVMPPALLAVILMPLGLETMPLWVMSKGIDLTLLIAAWVGGLPGASFVIHAMPVAAALFIAAGAIWACLWRGWLRVAGAPLVMAGLALAPLGTRPDVLVEAKARNVAVRADDGRLVPANPRRARYTVERWLLKDGDGADPSEAVLRPGWSCDDKICRASVEGKRVVYARDGAPLDALCSTADILITDFPLRRRCSDAPVRIDRFDVWRNGAYALYIKQGRVRVISAGQLRGARPWATAPLARRSILVPAAEANAAER